MLALYIHVISARLEEAERGEVIRTKEDWSNPELHQPMRSWSPVFWILSQKTMKQTRERQDNLGSYPLTYVFSHTRKPNCPVPATQWPPFPLELPLLFHFLFLLSLEVDNSRRKRLLGLEKFNCDTNMLKGFLLVPLKVTLLHWWSKITRLLIVWTNWKMDIYLSK